MTDSPRLEEVIAGVFAEHRPSFDHVGGDCGCGAAFVEVDEWSAHVAERLAARFEQMGFMLENGTNVYVRAEPPTQLANVPVFRLVGGDQ